jgi:hypothetical protein
MTLVQHHEERSQWWTTQIGNYVFSLDGHIVEVRLGNPDGKRIGDFDMRAWLNFRDGIDALYKVWQEQHPCQ